MISMIGWIEVGALPIKEIRGASAPMETSIEVEVLKMMTIHITNLEGTPPGCLMHHVRFTDLNNQSASTSV